MAPAVKKTAQNVANVVKGDTLTISKEASEAFRAYSLANIDKKPVNTFGDDGSGTAVRDLIRSRLLTKAGIYGESDSVRKFTSTVIKADKDASGIIQKLKGINIDNLAATSDGKGIRGQSLLSTKKKGLLPHIKEAGVKRVIDLRTDGSYTKCEAMCNRAGLEYYKFPIAYDAKWSNEDIEKIPDFINELSKGDYYIGCATGVHRTDVALALNYFFNPKADVIPKIEATAVGNKGTSVVVKILSTINDICYKDKTKTQVRLSDDFAQKLGWDSVDKLLEELPKRRAALCSANGISLN